MKLIRISALVLTGAVAVALTACEPKQDSAGDSKDDSVSSDKGKDDSGDAGGDKEESQGSLGAITSVTLIKSGGFSGIEETLEIDAKGNWEYVKARMAPKKGELSSGELEDLLESASQADITDVGKKSDKQCNDMQTYRLTVVPKDGDKVEANTDDCGISPNEPFDDIVELLGEATPI